MTIGLRERKRRQVAHELARAAFGLTVERGLDGFTIEELTERAGYARRTFTNYYSCKEEAVTALAVEQLQAGVDSLPGTTESESLIDWVQRLAKHQLTNGLMDTLVQLTQLAEGNPGLEAHLARVFAQIRQHAWSLVQERFGDTVTPQETSILVGAAYGAMTMMLTQVARTAADGSVVIDAQLADVFLDEVFGKLKAGFG